MINPIQYLSITLYDIDRVYDIDETRQWQPLMYGDIDFNQRIFVGFYAGESAKPDDIEYDSIGREVLWVYKTPYTLIDILEGEITPAEILYEVAQEQPNIEIIGLCKYVRDIPIEKS